MISGYALSLGAGLVLGGRLGDRFGRRRTFLIGLGAFTVASLLPQGLGLLRENFSGKELAAVFGIFGPVLGIGGVLGPIIGVGLVQANIADIGWRAVFLVNVPIGLAAMVMAWIGAAAPSR